jgi:GDP-L-fucose synthase
METKDKIFVAGHNGLVGSSILNLLKSRGYKNLLTRTHKNLDLTNQKAVLDFFESEKPDCVILAAAKVGGIYANSTYPSEFIYNNIMIQTNVIHASFKFKIKQLMFLGSSCIYPKESNQPIKESELLSGYLEPTNEQYAIAKISGIKLCEAYNRQFDTDFRSVMPTNLYGPNDNFHSKNSHVVPALMRRFHEAKVNSYSEVVVWGNGNARREFMFVDDLADAVLHIACLDKKLYQSKVNSFQSHINLGTGSDISIQELANIMKDVVSFKGKLVFDKSKPSGTPRKLLDSSIIDSMNWSPKVDLIQGLNETYEWFQSSGV